MQGIPLAFGAGATTPTPTPTPTTIGGASGSYPTVASATRLFTVDASKTATLSFLDVPSQYVGRINDAAAGGVYIAPIDLQRTFTLVPNQFGPRPALVYTNSGGVYPGRYQTAGDLTAANNAGALFLVFKPLIAGWQPIILGSGDAGAPQLIFGTTDGVGGMTLSHPAGSVSFTVPLGTPAVLGVRWNSSALTVASNRFSTVSGALSGSPSPVVALDRIQLSVSDGSNGSPQYAHTLLDLLSGTPNDATMAATVAAYASQWGM